MKYKKGKKSKLRLKWKIFAYLLGFSCVLITMLWILQTVYLDDFYKMIKMNELDAAVSSVEEQIDSSNLESVLNTVSKTYDLCVMITEKEGNILYTADANNDCSIHFMNTIQLQEYYAKAKSANGFLAIRSEEVINHGEFNRPDEPGWNRDENRDANRTEDIPQSNDAFSAPGGFQGIPRRNTSLDGVIHIKILTMADGTEVALFANSIITPVDATVYTIRVQLVFISAVLIFLALIMSTFISMIISKSITKINSGAKQLAKGDFNVVFDAKDYKEVAELSDTLNYTAEELGKAEGIQRELIANVSHDLRTPLTMITAYSEVLRDIPGENTPENVQVIVDEAKRLSMLVNDLLDISKLQAGAEVVDMKEYDLTEAIKGVIDRYAKLAKQDGYKVIFRYYENVIVNADEFKIYQVIYNLINNAINYAGADKTVIVNQIVNGDIVRIEVCDSGIGIAKEELKNVWERYYKIDKEHKRAVMGTGLGLSIVKNILVKHNARFGVDSELGKGSKFWFELKTVSSIRESEIDS